MALSIFPTIKNRYGVREHPYHTPFFITKDSKAFPLTTTLALASLKISFVILMNLVGIPYSSCNQRESSNSFYHRLLINLT
jgi:hypothetical protein